MANNKVQLANGTVLIDLTDTTAVESDVISGKEFYGANGEKVSGTIPIQTAVSITPSRETQVAISAGTYISEDVIVNPIPPQYGLVSWNGSVLSIT